MAASKTFLITGAGQPGGLDGLSIDDYAPRTAETVEAWQRSPRPSRRPTRCGPGRCHRDISTSLAHDDVPADA
jgi:hypothetical protein